MNSVRHDWTVQQIRELYELPLMQLIDRARDVHRAEHAADEVQLCTLLSIKTGGCPENCSYCSQSAHYDTGLKREPMVQLEDVIAAARRAKASGSTRFCMGAAWREVKEGAQFDSVLEMVRGVKELGLEACCTLGMLSESQAVRLKEAGLDAYNHNIDTSASHYRSIVTTRSQSQRFQTLSNVRNAGISVCSGGIIGMGESTEDRCAMLMQLATLSPHPESVPINSLVPIAGTPLADLPPLDSSELIRTIACARIIMPLSRVRLSAGRKELSRETQLLCLMAGANSIFYGDRLLTTDNPDVGVDRELLEFSGLRPSAPAPLEASARMSAISASEQSTSAQPSAAE